MYFPLKFLIVWPTEKWFNTISNVFKQLYPKCIIDCSEAFIGTPENFDVRSKTLTKKHNTINIWVVTPVAAFHFTPNAGEVEYQIRY